MLKVLAVLIIDGRRACFLILLILMGIVWALKIEEIREVDMDGQGQVLCFGIVLLKKFLFKILQEIIQTGQLDV